MEVVSDGGDGEDGGVVVMTVLELGGSSSGGDGGAVGGVIGVVMEVELGG